ncbi:hypothetical protein PUN28_005742 [Cardiocondyla obscurior]
MITLQNEFILYKWILIYDIVTLLLLHTDTICAINAEDVKKFAGVVENITVHVVEDSDYFINDNATKSLKLNISWMPPNEGKQPSSYSVIITSVLKETNVNKTECTEGLAYYPALDKNLLSVLIPRNKLLYDMTEVQIHPNCTYKISVYANPRSKRTEKSPEILYTVPECIGNKCNCANAKFTLPVPKVEVIQAKKRIAINWSVMSNSSQIRSYIISIGLPLFVSKAGYSVYNITKISNVTSATNTFSWDMKINGQHISIKNGYKILIAPMDHQGCIGTQGFVIVSTNRTEISNKSTMWLLFTGVVICVILGFTSIMAIYNKNGYQLVSTKW